MIDAIKQEHHIPVKIKQLVAENMLILHSSIDPNIWTEAKSSTEWN